MRLKGTFPLSHKGLRHAFRPRPKVAAAYFMQSGNISLADTHGAPSDESFQQLLLRFSAAAAHGGDTHDLIRLFCKETREFFQVSGTYFWEITSPEEMVGTEADGLMVERFRGSRLSLAATQKSVALETVRCRKTLFRNDLNT
jgi:hypothetical protein